MARIDPAQSQPGWPRVLLVDDHLVIRESLAAMLRGAGMTVLGEFADAETALDFTRRHPADVALIDVLLEKRDGMDGLELVRHLKSMSKPPAVIVLSSVRAPATIRASYDLGVDAYVPKATAGRELLLAAIRAVASGERLGEVAAWKDAQLSTPPAAGVLEQAGVSPREREVLAYVGTGAENLQIASFLQISERTVRAHVSALYRKLEKGNRTELALVARDLGLRPLPQ